MSTTPYKVRCRVCTKIESKEMSSEQVKLLRPMDLICDACANRSVPIETPIEVEVETPSYEQEIVAPQGAPVPLGRGPRDTSKNTQKK